MNESEENFDFEDKRLSLIDVSFEDDCLYNSPSRDFQIHQFSGNQKEDKSAQFLGVEDANSEQTSLDGLEGEEQEPQPMESFEPERKIKNSKYNLRKSLAWDNAFFTSAGVLEPEELSSMIGAENGGKHVLPGIEEDIHGSTDSLSTLASDNLTSETLEAGLFEDIRASIQKSSKASNVENSSSKMGIGITQNQTIQSSEKVDIAPQNKLKDKAAPKKPNAVMQGSEKITKRVSVCPQASKRVAINGESKSLCKPPKVMGRVSPVITPATKRGSLGANHVKVEKDNAKSSTGDLDSTKKLTGRGAKIPTLGGSRNTVPRPTLLSKSSLASSVTSKTELTTSASLDSSESLSSDSSSKSSMSSVRRKIDSRTGNRSSSSSTAKTTLKITSRNKNQSMSSHLSPYLKSVTKLPSSISPASSISEWSSESLSPTSTVNKRSSSSRSSLDTISCRDTSRDGDAPQVLDLQNHSNDQRSVGHGNQLGLPGECIKKVSTGSSAILRPDSIKPSGLRMPSPKIGFFDGVRSSVRTPNRSTQSHPAVPNGLPRFRTGRASPNGASKDSRLVKLQPTRTVTAVRSTNILDQQPALGIQPKSSLPLQEPSNAAAPKVCSASRNEKRHPGTSLKVQNRMSPEISGGSNLMAEKVTSKECNIAVNNPDFGFNERHGSLCVLKDKMNSESKGNALVKDTTITPTKELSVTISNSSSISELENTTLLQKVGENAMYGQNYIKNKLHSLHDTNEKEQACFEDQVDGLTKQLGAAAIHGEIQKETIGDSVPLCQVNINRESDFGQDEFLKLSKPTSSLTPITGSTVVEEEKTATLSHPASISGNS